MPAVPIRVALIAALLLVAPRAAADEPDARQLFDRGAARAAGRDYDGAAADFEASFAQDGRKEALFAWAQAERLGGHCTRAIELYRRFLANGGITANQREAADLNIRRCQREGDTPAPAPPPPSPLPALAAPAPTIVIAPAPARSRRAVMAGVVLAGAAAGALAASGTFFVLSRIDERQALSVDTTWDDYYGPARRARTTGFIALGLLGGGVALGGAALLEWILSAPRGLSAGLGPAGVTVAGHF
jgi:hypothetical protein